MDSAIRLYFDESVEIAIAKQMQQRGIDSVTVRDLNLLSDTDSNHLKRAAEMGRVLCTYDSDYIELARSGIEHAGIVIAAQRKTTIGDWVRGLELICGVYSADDMKNQVEYLLP